MENSVENGGQARLRVEKQRYNRKESAEYLGVSVVTVDRAIASRKISFFRLGRRVVFDKRHLDEYLERHEYRAKVKERNN
jgi:excisionase family DNA binding protein